MNNKTRAQTVNPPNNERADQPADGAANMAGRDRKADVAEMKRGENDVPGQLFNHAFCADPKKDEPAEDLFCSGV